MTESKDKLFAEFPPVSTQEWMEKVTADLKGADFNRKLVWRTNEGFDLKPMYRSEDIKDLKSTDSLPGDFPYLRGTRIDNNWKVRQNIRVSDVATANEKIATLIGKGVNSFGLHLKKDCISTESLTALVSGIALDSVELNFTCCQKAIATLTANLVEVFKASGVEASKINANISIDAVSVTLKKGGEVENATAILKEAIALTAEFENVRVININSLILNNGGAYIAQELGYALAWGQDIIARLIEEGVEIDAIAKNIHFTMGVGSNYFMELAKFRAARMLWAYVVDAYSPKDGASAKMYVNAETSRFNMTIFDANVNMLRTQTEAMSAALAGVDSITVTPYDAIYKESDEFSERIARNQQLLLKEESHLDKVVDPAAGSYYIEHLTQAIAEQAWALFLAVEQEGGFVALVKSGEIQHQINSSAAARMKAAASRKETLLGTNQFPNFTEAAGSKIAAKGGCDCGCGNNAKSEIATINRERLATEFEELRLATEAASNRPKVFMLTIGNLAMRLARAQFSSNFFACAGYEIIDNLGFETVEAGLEAAKAKGADIVVLCSSDDEYATFAPEAKAALPANMTLVVAGAPACMEELKAQGIADFINVKSNVLTTLKSFNEKLLK